MNYMIAANIGAHWLAFWHWLFPAVVKIDRSEPFTPSNGDEVVWQDPRVLGVSEVDLRQICLIEAVRDDDEELRSLGVLHVSADEGIKRLQASGRPLLDAAACEAVLQNQKSVRRAWRSGFPKTIDFPGTIMKESMSGRLYIVTLYTDGRRTAKGVKFISSEEWYFSGDKSAAL